MGTLFISIFGKRIRLQNKIYPFKCSSIQQIRSKLPSDINTYSDLLDSFENIITLQCHNFDEESLQTEAENDERIVDNDVLVITSNGPPDNDFILTMLYLCL